MVSMVTFIIATSLIAMFTRSTFQDKVRNDMMTTMMLLSDYSVIPLEDDNKSNANEILASLRVKESIEYASIYNRNRSLFGVYGRDSESLTDEKIPKYRDGRGYEYTEEGRLVMWQAIVREDVQIGSIVIQSDLGELSELFRQIYTVIFMSLFLSLGLGYILAKELQANLSKPILSLSETAKQISEDKDFSARATKFGDDEVGVLTDSFNDMLEQIQISNTALKESQERYRSFVQNSSEPTFRIDYDPPIPINFPISEQLGMHRSRATIVQNNKAFRDLYGFEEHDEISYADIHEMIDEEIVRSAFSPVLPMANIETKMVVTEDNERVLLTSIVRTVEQGSLIRMWITQRDVTELRKAEEEQDSLQRQLIQVQKMDSVGQLAGGIAHDFNNILVAILGYVELAQGLDEEAGLPEPISSYHREIEQAANRAASLTRQLLAFSRRQIMELKRININEMLSDLEDLLKRLIPETIDMEFTQSEEPAIILADLVQLEQVVINMAVNARDAMPDGGKISLCVRHVTFDEEYVQDHPWAKIGNFIVLEIVDTGSGMPPEVQEKVFEPFFTTKPMDKGTGLGMSVALGIIEQHNGFIQVYSEEGMGSDIKIYLPSIRSRSVSKPKEIIESAPKGSETVLLVEDEDQVRNIARTILERSGYSVIEAKDGEEGLAMYEQHKDSIQLLLLDVVMPKLGGEEVMKALREQGVTVPIVFTSGYSGGGIHDGFILEEGFEFLAKPYNRKKLQEKIRHVLDHHSA